MGYSIHGGLVMTPIPVPTPNGVNYKTIKKELCYMIQCDVDEISFVFLPDFNEMMSNYEEFLFKN